MPLTPDYLIVQLDASIYKTWNFRYLTALSTWAWQREENYVLGFGTARLFTSTATRRFQKLEDAYALWAKRQKIASMQLTTAGAEPSEIKNAEKLELLRALGAFTFADDSRQSSLLAQPILTLTKDASDCFLVISTRAWPAIEGLSMADLITTDLTNPILGDANFPVYTLAKLAKDATYFLRNLSCAAADFFTPQLSQINRTVTWNQEAQSWAKTIEKAISRLQDKRTALEKVVLARKRTLSADIPWNLTQLSYNFLTAYPHCWFYKIGGFLGATPELLVSKDTDVIHCHLLAGTCKPDDASGQELIASPKNLTEHSYAADSVLAALQDAGAEITGQNGPYLEKLPNVYHLATDVYARGEQNVLELVASLHPTAAVGGTPTQLALQTIAELEPYDRGLYAGPVGYVSAAGSGAWGLALRGAELSKDGTQLTAFAGGGIIVSSVATEEETETDIKLQAVGLVANR